MSKQGCVCRSCSTCEMAWGYDQSFNHFKKKRNWGISDSSDTLGASKWPKTDFGQPTQF